MGMRALPPPPFGLPPAARARHVDPERRRALARALHAAPAAPPSIAARLEALHAAISAYRARAIQLHARLFELEAAGNDNVAPLRRALIEASVQIEDTTRALLALRDARRR